MSCSLFRNLGDNSEEDCLAEAITNDLTIELAQIPGVLVIAHTSGVVEKDGPINIRRIGEELGVRFAVEGVLRKLGDKIRIGVKLIATATNQQIWADRFDEEVGDLTTDHDGVVHRISSMLDSRLLDAETAISVKERPDNPNALDLLLRAWTLFKKPADSQLLKRTTELLEQALQLEPSSAPTILSLVDRLIHRSTEAQIYAKYILQERPNAKIGILYQNDDYGKDYPAGMKADEVGRRDMGTLR